MGKRRRLGRKQRNGAPMLVPCRTCRRKFDALRELRGGVCLRCASK
jgi:hypothetical protein